MEECLGKCASCESEDIDYETIEIGSSGEIVYYPYKCKKCGHEGKEWHTLVYAGSE